jgi:hypothetical protein
MALDGNFDAIDEAALVSLQANGITEGPVLEFKREPYGRADADKKEFLKDLTALANTLGGHLLVGIDEVAGGAGPIVPFVGDADAELLRLESLARDGVQPRIVGLRMRAVPVSGGVVIAIQVPRSLQAPHRVVFQGTNRFYGRNSAGVHELSVDELRVAFTSQATAREKAAAFRSERLALVSAGEGALPDLDFSNGALVLHVIPWTSMSGGAVDIDQARELDGPFSPINRSGWSPRFNLEGFICTERGVAYTQVFRSGALEAVVTGLTSTISGRKGFSGLYLERLISESLTRYLTGLQQLGVGGPALVGLSLLRVAGSAVHIGRDFADHYGTELLRHDRVDLPSVVIEDWAVMPDMKRALRLPFDTLWNAVGATRARLFDADGNWIGE